MSVLGPAINATLPYLRSEAESLMTDSCTVTRQTGEPTFDETTGQYTYPPPTTVYTGKCRVQIRAAAGEHEAPTRAVRVQAEEIQLPMDATEDVAPGDVVTIDSSPWSAGLVGRKFTVSDRFDKSQATSRRLQMQEVVA